MAEVRTGLERLVGGEFPRYRQAKTGLVTNPNGTDSAFRSSVSLLAGSEHCRLERLFGPEHGIRGNAQAGDVVAGERDPVTGLAVYSLYGETKRPTAEMLAGLDAIMIDLQDPGVRFTTYFSTMVEVLAAGNEYGVEVAILDRPNPLGGAGVRGNLLDPTFGSFVGAHPVTTLHGLTLGELGLLVAKARGWAEPTVIPMDGWSREMWFDQTGLPWIPPSPNLPTLDALTVYPGTCLLEGTSLSEGRGTTKPFEFVGSVGIEPEALAEDLRARRLPSLAFRPVYFQPMFSKQAGQMCGGVQVYCTDRDGLDGPGFGLHLLEACRKLDPGFAWIEHDPGRFFIDLLLGSDRPRLALEQGVVAAEIVAGWDAEVEGFGADREQVLIYR